MWENKHGDDFQTAPKKGVEGRGGKRFLMEEKTDEDFNRHMKKIRKGEECLKENWGDSFQTGDEREEAWNERGEKIKECERTETVRVMGPINER